MTAAQIGYVNINTMLASSVNSSAKLNSLTAPAIQQPSKDVFQKVSEVSKKTGKTNKKKIGKAVLIGAAVLGAITGAAILVASQIKKGKLLGAEGVKKYADNIQKQAENIRQEVVELFNNHGMKDGKQVAEIVEENGKSIMTEVFGESSSRESKFINDMLESVKVTTKKGNNFFQFLTNAKLSRYGEGYEELANGGYRTAKILDFYLDSGKLADYYKNYEVHAGWKYEKNLHFIDDALESYTKGFEECADGSWKYAKKFRFGLKSGALESYIKGFEDDANGNSKIAKDIIFTKGELPIIRRNVTMSY